ncbi:hypothetical protein BKA56DRAFT_590033 [Ilyonectria sp. MPI-CAGE-AT-0026]|nr:hypothetical protein BKA56DRAFT_590033 [Ilyonectria sp. MPI-CAGE-AT-0026]
MLPSSLVSVYQEYKKDTNLVASWLASTAKICGFPADLVPTPTPPKQPKTSGRSKGKPRRGGKKKGKAGSRAAPEVATTYVIAMKNFIPLAECIAASKDPVISIPVAFSKALNRVIAVRSRFGEKFSVNGVEVNAESDVGHSYFVGVLEKVRDLLSPLVSTAASASSDSSDPIESLNKFDGLEIYEPSEAFLNAPDIARPGKTGRENIIYEAEPPHSLEDALIVFWMMLDDLAKIRDFISSTWSDSVERPDKFLDPAAMALATNTGIDFARILIENASPAFEDYGGAHSVCKEYFERLLVKRGYSGEDIRAWTQGDTKHDFYGVASGCYFNTGNIIKSLARFLFKDYAPIYPDGAFGVYDTATDWEAKTGHEKFKEDEMILTELFMEALTIVHHVPDYLIVDEFIRGVREFHETQKVPFYLTFAAEMTLDIHHRLRGHCESSATILLDRLSSMSETLKSHIRIHENLKTPLELAATDDYLKECQEFIDEIIQDPLHISNIKFQGPQRLELPKTTKKHRILRLSPIVAGLVLYHCRALMHQIGIAATNVWRTIILPAHLYNAVLNERFTSCVWYDMELLFKELGEDQFFVGTRPMNRVDYIKHFLLQIGVSASFFTNRRRLTSGAVPNKNNYSKAGGRSIKLGATVTRGLLTRYRYTTGLSTCSPESIEELLLKSRSEEQEIAGVRVAGGTKGAKEPVLGDPRSKRAAGATKQRFSAGELLGSLLLAMQAEVVEFAFPYLLMHQLNWGLLKTIQTRCDPMLRENFGPNYLRWEWRIPFMVGHILRLRDGPIWSRAMVEIGDVFDTLGATKAASSASTALMQSTGMKLEVPGCNDKDGMSGSGESSDTINNDKIVTEPRESS